MRHITGVYLLAIVLLIIIVGGYPAIDDSVKVNLSNKTSEVDETYDLEYIRIGVSSVISPVETLIYYQDLFDYISSKIGVPVKLIQRKNYQEMNDLLRRNGVDAAFICSFAYVEGHDQFGLELLAVPIVKGEPYYYSYIIVPKDSNINSLKELKGKTFAYTDPLSNSGKLSPEYLLVKMGENPVTFFKMTFFTYSHDKSLRSAFHRTCL